MKTIRSWRSLAGVLAASVSVMAAAQSPTPSNTARAKPATDASAITVSVGGQNVEFGEGKPMMMKQQVLVPFRAILEKMGAQVTYDPGTKKIVASQAGHQVNLAVGSNEAQVDGRPITMSLPATARNGTTYIPLRFVSESLGGKADYDAATHAVKIEPGQATQSAPNSGAGSTDAQTMAGDNSASANDVNSAGSAGMADNASNSAGMAGNDANNAGAANMGASNMSGANGGENAGVNAAGTNGSEVTNAPSNAGRAPTSPATTPVADATQTNEGSSVLQYWPFALLALAIAAGVAWLLSRRRSGQVIASDASRRNP